jgi:FixJ family two-component response regulator
VLNALSFAFETDGYQVRACRDGAALLAQPPIEPDTCLVLDERLAGRSGLDLLALLRARGVAAPAILITTRPNAETRARAANAGVTIVEKPLLGDVLAHKVREILGR